MVYYEMGISHWNWTL